MVQIEDDIPTRPPVPSLLLVDDLQDEDEPQDHNGNVTVSSAKRSVTPPPVPPSTIRKAFILDSSDDSDVDLGNFEIPEEPARNVDSVLNRFKKNAMNFFKKK